MDQNDIDQLRAQIATAVQAATDATAEATHIGTEATVDHATAAIAITTAAQEKIDTATARTKIETQLIATYGLITTLQTQLAVVTDGPLPSQTPAVFTLTPGQISPNLILDYVTKEDKGIYDKATIPSTIIFEGAIKNIQIY